MVYNNASQFHALHVLVVPLPANQTQQQRRVNTDTLVDFFTQDKGQILHLEVSLKTNTGQKMINNLSVFLLFFSLNISALLCIHLQAAISGNVSSPWAASKDGGSTSSLKTMSSWCPDPNLYLVINDLYQEQLSAI